MECSQAHRSQASTEAPTGLGHSLPARSREASPRPGIVRPRDRQQASRMRPREDQIGELVSGGHVRTQAIVIQQKTGRPVQFELLEPARSTILAWLERRGGYHRRLRFSEPDRSCRTYQHWAVRSACRRVGRGHRLACGGLRHALAPSYQSFHHLQKDRQPTGRADGIPRSRAQFATSASTSKTR